MEDGEYNINVELEIHKVEGVHSMIWLDLAIVIGILVFIIAGLRRGFFRGLVELLGIMVSVSIPILFYIPAGRILEGLGISRVYSGALAFVIIFLITVPLYYALAERLYRLIPSKILSSWINKGLGVLTGLLKGFVIVTLLLAVITALPIQLITSENIEKSTFGSSLLDFSIVATSLAVDIFDEPLQHALGFLTIETDASESLDLKFTVTEPIIDQEAEKEMLRLLNKERAQQGLPELVMDEALREVARQHSVDMFQRGYFGHIDPDGNTPFDRMRDGGISFVIAGENVAVAPTVSLAHQGLMNSPGHRENILRSQYHRVGIGAAQNSRHGIIFTQKFAN